MIWLVRSSRGFTYILEMKGRGERSRARTVARPVLERRAWGFLRAMKSSPRTT